MREQRKRLPGILALTLLAIVGGLHLFAHAKDTRVLDQRLAEALARAGFTGTVQASLDSRLGRPLDPALVDLGRLVLFNDILGLHNDNVAAGCHSPAAGSGDTQGTGSSAPRD
jgi:cytochrome c peroxidase